MGSVVFVFVVVVSVVVVAVALAFYSLYNLKRWLGVGGEQFFCFCVCRVNHFGRNLII